MNEIVLSLILALNSYAEDCLTAKAYQDYAVARGLISNEDRSWWFNNPYNVENDLPLIQERERRLANAPFNFQLSPICRDQILRGIEQNSAFRTWLDSRRHSTQSVYELKILDEVQKEAQDLAQFYYMLRDYSTYSPNGYNGRIHAKLLLQKLNQYGGIPPALPLHRFRDLP